MNKVYLGNGSFERDPSLILKCEKALKAFLERADLGFPFLPARQELLAEVEKVGSEMRKKWTHFVVVGIGGSSLGGLAIAEALNKDNVLFLDNVDMVLTHKIMGKIQDFSKWGWIFISKSGTTIETLATLEWVDAFYAQKGLRLCDFCAVVTEPVENSLGRWADQRKVPRLTVPKDVGGRFSVLSPVGMLPAYLMGLSPASFLKGAEQCLQSTEFLVSLMAQFVASFSRHEWITLFWQYSSEMKSFGGWIQQLWCESLAKKMDRRGQAAPRVSTGIWAVGASDQHSILQQVMEGYKDKFVVFMRYQDVEELPSEQSGNILKSSQFPETATLVGKTLGQLLAAEAQATCEGLQQEGVSTLNIHVSRMNEETLGFLFMTFQLVVAGLGEYLDINAFDQPGVETGKKLAKKILQTSLLA